MGILSHFSGIYTVGHSLEVKVWSLNTNSTNSTNSTRETFNTELFNAAGFQHLVLTLKAFHMFGTCSVYVRHMFGPRYRTYAILKPKKFR